MSLFACTRWHAEWLLECRSRRSTCLCPLSHTVFIVSKADTHSAVMLCRRSLARLSRQSHLMVHVWQCLPHSLSSQERQQAGRTRQRSSRYKIVIQVYSLSAWLGALVLLPLALAAAHVWQHGQDQASRQRGREKGKRLPKSNNG